MRLGLAELLVILFLALIIFGPGKLPEVGRAFGRTIGEFKKAARENKEEDRAEESTKTE